jgi:hypothetical protein
MVVIYDFIISRKNAKCKIFGKKCQVKNRGNEG